MNTIEQAKQVVELLKDGQAGDCSPIGNRYAAIETINALIAELASIKTGQKPVAWVDVVDRHEGPYNFNGQELLDSGRHNLYLAAGAYPAPCNPLCELCIKRGYTECANVTVTTPLPMLAQGQRKP